MFGLLPVVFAANNTVFIDGYLVTSSARTYDYNLSIYNSTNYIGLYNVSSTLTSGSIPATVSLTSYNITLNGSILTSNLAIDSFGDSHVQVYRYSITYANGSTMLTENSPLISGSYSTPYVFTSTNISHDIPIQKIELQRVSSSGGTPIVCNYGGCTYSYETPGYINASLANGTYRFYANDSRYATTNQNVTIGTVSGYDNFTFRFYSTNSLVLNFYDETNNTLINWTTVTIGLSGSILGYNYSTTTGTVTATLLITDNYSISYSAPAYNQRTYNTTVTSGGVATLNLYLLPTTYATTSLFTVKDVLYGNVVPNAQVYVNRKNSTGSNYYTVETCNTDFNGECVVSLQLVNGTNKPVYQVLIYYGGNLAYSSGDTSFLTNSRDFQINIGNAPLQNVFSLEGSYFNLTETHNTTNVTFNYAFSDILGTITYSCMKVTYRSYATGGTIYDFCDANNTASITLVTALQGQEVCAQGYAIFSDGTSQGAQTVCLVNTQASGNTGAKGLFYIVLPLLITFVMIFRERPGLAIMGACLVLATTFFIGILDTTTLVIGGILIGGVALYLGQKA